MNADVKSNSLSEKDADIIEQYARNSLTKYNKLNDVIGTQIFQILELNSRVLYYPLEDEDIWGFLERTRQDQFFVCINSSIAYDKQVFVAAHELYHIWYDQSDGEELILPSNLEDCKENEHTIDSNELKANRFAAAFLINQGLLVQEMLTYSIPKNSPDVKQVLKLANLFLVPYKTMVRRLFEVNLINHELFSSLMDISHKELQVLRTRLGITLPIREKNIVLDNLIENAMLLYEKGLITVEKLEQILRYSKLTLQDVGIEKTGYTPPTDNELDDIMGE